MNEAGNAEQSLYIKDYLQIIWGRKWLVSVCLFLSIIVTTSYIYAQSTIWRINAKMLITKTGSALPVSELTQDNSDRFIPTQIELLTGPTLLKKVLLRTRKTPDQFNKILKNVKINRVSNTDIIFIAVDSTSPVFGTDFINILYDEYTKLRERQRVTTAEIAVQTLKLEIDKLGLELKYANQKLFDFSKEHNVAAELIRSASGGDNGNHGSGTDFFERWRHHANVLMHCGEELADAVARKQLLDARPNAAAVVALLADERAAAAEDRAAEAVATGEIKTGDILNIIIPQSKMLDARVIVSTNWIILYSPLGNIDIKELNTDTLAVKIQTDLLQASLIKPMAANETTVRVTISSGTNDISDNPLNVHVFGTTVTRTTMGALKEIEIDKLFTLDRRRLIAQSRVDSLLKLYKGKHPALIPATQELRSAIDDEDATIQFYRQKADAEVLVAERKYNSLQSAGKQLESEALLYGTQLQQVRLLREECDRLRLLYNGLLNQLVRLNMTENIKIYTISMAEYPFVESEPIYPKKMKIFMVGIFIGLGVGGGMAFSLKYLDDIDVKVKSVVDIKEQKVIDKEVGPTNNCQRF